MVVTIGTERLLFGEIDQSELIFLVGISFDDLGLGEVGDRLWLDIKVQVGHLQIGFRALEEKQENKNEKSKIKEKKM